MSMNVVLWNMHHVLIFTKFHGPQWCWGYLPIQKQNKNSKKLTEEMVSVGIQRLVELN